MNALISKVSGQKFTTIYRDGKDVTSLLQTTQNEDITEMFNKDLLERESVSEACSAEEILDAVKVLIMNSCEGWKMAYAYTPCEDYASAVFYVPGRAIEYTISTEAGRVEHELCCAEAEAKEIRKAGY